jgi:hypothetical protein
MNNKYLDSPSLLRCTAPNTSKMKTHISILNWWCYGSRNFQISSKLFQTKARAETQYLSVRYSDVANDKAWARLAKSDEEIYIGKQLASIGSIQRNRNKYFTRRSTSYSSDSTEEMITPWEKDLFEIDPNFVDYY